MELTGDQQTRTNDDAPIIEVRGVKKHFAQQQGIVSQFLGGERSYVKAVDGVDLQISAGEAVGIVGESGCGKSTLAEVLVGIQEATAGDITYLGNSLNGMSKSDKREFRRRAQMVFQDPFSSINPRFSIREWVKEPLDIHDIDDKEARVVRALDQANLRPPEKYLDQYPHQLSGGERQRVCIARALVLEPDFIVADEPVSMLDVSIRASVLDLMDSLIRDHNIGALYISHDLSMIRQMCDRTHVMYLGKIVEEGPTETIIRDPKHPYTRALVDAVPVPNPSNKLQKPRLEGEPPDPVNLPDGCNFKPRCPYATDECLEEPTQETYVDDEAAVRASCWRVDEIETEN